MPHRRKPKSSFTPPAIGVPPGLEQDMCFKFARDDHDEALANDNVDAIDLARRLQRLELLLFSTPEPDF